jgi:hypothetical protein
VIERLKQEGVKLQFYKSITTSSIYIKLDYGVLNSIRISDHAGKRYLKYRYNLIKGCMTPYYICDRYIRYYYPLKQADRMIDDILKHRDEKLMKYGVVRYKKFMENNKANKSSDGGFWSQSVELN